MERDPIVILILAVTIGSLFGRPSRAGRVRGALLGGASAVALTWLLHGPPGRVILAAALGALFGALAPMAQRSGRRRREWSGLGGDLSRGGRAAGAF